MLPNACRRDRVGAVRGDGGKEPIQDAGGAAGQ